MFKTFSLVLLVSFLVTSCGEKNGSSNGATVTRASCSELDHQTNKANALIEQHASNAFTSLSFIADANDDENSNLVFRYFDSYIDDLRGLRDAKKNIISSIPKNGLICKSGSRKIVFTITNWNEMSKDVAELDAAIATLESYRSNFIYSRESVSQVLTDTTTESVSNRKTKASKPTSTTSTLTVSSVRTGSLTGVVKASNGVDPVAKATVYVPVEGNDADKFSSIPSDQGDGSCEAPGVPFLTMTCSNGSGAYKFEKLPATEFTISVKKGLFQIYAISVSIIANETVSYSPELPKQTDENGKIPRIAVVSGKYDNLAKVLNKLGLEGAYEVVSSAGDIMSADKLVQFDVIMVNCGTDETCIEPNKAMIEKFVALGGRLFVTDQAYDFVERVFPGYIDFFGNDLTPNAAQSGGGGEVFSAKVDDPHLKGWLRTVGALSADGSVKIAGFSGSWAKMESVGPLTKVLASNSDRPLAVTFKYGEGKVFYSSYHTHYGSVAGLTPQEWMLKYFILDLVD